MERQASDSDRIKIVASTMVGRLVMYSGRYDGPHTVEKDEKILEHMKQKDPSLYNHIFRDAAAILEALDRLED